MLKSKRRSLVLLLFVAFLIVYSGLWYYVCGLVQNALVQVFERASNHEMSMSCANIRKTGFPLRVGVGCDAFDFQQLPDGVAFSTQKLRASAPVYAPSWVELSVHSPAQFWLPGLKPLATNWKNMTVHVDLGGKVPDIISLSGEGIRITTQEDAAEGDAAEGQEVLSARFLRLDIKGLHSDMSGKISFDDIHLPLAIFETSKTLPPIDGTLNWQLKDAHRLFQNGTITHDSIKANLRGREGMLEPSEIRFTSGGKLSISGPFSFDEEGYLNAQFNISVSEQQGLAQALQDIFPSQEKNIRSALFAINSMPKDKNGDPVLGLNIKQGEMRIGFIKLGRLDPI